MTATPQPSLHWESSTLIFFIVVRTFNMRYTFSQFQVHNTVLFTAGTVLESRPLEHIHLASSANVWNAGTVTIGLNNK